jgi:hypothetical protein
MPQPVGSDPVVRFHQGREGRALRLPTRKPTLPAHAMSQENVEVVRRCDRFCLSLS